MTALALTITDAGRAALVALGGTETVTITEAGFTASTFVGAPTLTTLPGEFKRVDSVAGEAVNDTTIHLTIRDDSDDAYTVRAFALYLDDGTLFAFYNQADPILEKAELTIFFLAADVALEAADVEDITFGDTDFLNPPATESTKGVAYLATISEALAGAVDDKIITPAAMAAVLANYVLAAELGIANGVATLGPDGKLLLAQRPPIDLIDVWPVANQAAMLALSATVGDFAVRADSGLIYVLQTLPASTLGNWLEISTPAPVSSVNGKVGTVVLVPSDIGAAAVTRTITAAGLATGGGDLSANRTITVPKASPTEAAAGTDDTKALTPLAIAALVGGKVPAGRTITGGGLVTGGGDLSANRVLSVAIASPSDVADGTANDKALTPASLGGLPSSHFDSGYHTLPGGLIMQWIKYRGVITSETTFTLSFPTNFLSQVFSVQLTAHNASFSIHRNLWMQLVGEAGLSSFTCQTQTEEGDDMRLDGFDVLAIGI